MHQERNKWMGRYPMGDDCAKEKIKLFPTILDMNKGN